MILSKELDGNQMRGVHMRAVWWEQGGGRLLDQRRRRPMVGG